MENLKVKRFYNYSDIDGSYISYEDIVQDVWVLQIENKEYYANPAYSTDKEPLSEKKGFKVRFNIKENKWEYIKLDENNINNINKNNNELSKINNEMTFLKGIMNGTDWYVIRKLETGKDIPEQIKKDREELRIKISELQKKLIELSK